MLKPLASSVADASRSPCLHALTPRQHTCAWVQGRHSFFVRCTARTAVADALSAEVASRAVIPLWRLPMLGLPAVAAARRLHVLPHLQPRLATFSQPWQG